MRTMSRVLCGVDNPKFRPNRGVYLKSLLRTLQKLKVVRLYTRLYAARLGLVIHPQPRGALRPRLCRTARLIEVRAARLLRRLGFLIPNFIKPLLKAKFLTINLYLNNIDSSNKSNDHVTPMPFAI